MDECTLNDLLECSVCLERLDTSSKVLPCQHTFCKKCLEEILTTHRELRCPECRILVDAKIDELPPNVLLMRILEGMRNAAPNSVKFSSRINSTHRTPLPVATSCTDTASAGDLPRVTTTTSVGRINPIVVKQQPVNQAYARAMYDYVSKVPGDLSFQKGDIVLLRKKIDDNWYFGESGNDRGVFPLSYVQVITPLATHTPQCKALYDFKMTNDEEDGCLAFGKGQVINVIRRVDENWAEGKLLDRIGIFPLAFVELNSVARALMKLSTNAQPGPSRLAPPTPTSDETTPLIPTDHTRNLQTNDQLRPRTMQGAVVPISDSTPNVSSGSNGSTTTSPNTPNSSSTSSSSSTAPSSPSSPPAISPPALSNRQNLKRHSLTGTVAAAVAATDIGQHHALPHHRHSAEILGPGTDGTLGTGTTTITTASTTDAAVSSVLVGGGTVVGAARTVASTRHRRSGSSDLVLAQSSQNTNSSVPNNSGLPAVYVALYPYKPQKTDELELRKGGIYVVTERCQDGWFKGTSNRTQKCGVFPGNYVALAKCQRGLCRGSSSLVGPTVVNSSVTSGQNGEARLTTTVMAAFTGKTKGSVPHSQSQVRSHSQYDSRATLPPPELPPRALSPSPSTISSSWHGHNQASHLRSHARIHGQAQPQSREESSPTARPGELTKPVNPLNPLGRSHSAVVASNPAVSSPGKQLSTAPSAANPASNTITTVTGNTGPVQTAATAPAVVGGGGGGGITSMTTTESNASPNNSSRTLVATVTSASTATLGSTVAKAADRDKPKEKKDKCVSLMRRFTHIKKSKSPPPVAYSMDNPVFEDGNSTTNPIHVRSGSCPSQLLQTGSTPESNASGNQQRFLQSSAQTVRASSSQRSKCKERSSLPTTPAVPQRSSDASGTVCPTTPGNHHRKSNSLDAGLGKQMKQQSSRERQRVSRFRCIVPYPPNSEFELELRVGDIIYVHKKHDDGWYKGTQQRTGRTGLFPASFVETF